MKLRPAFVRFCV